MTYTERLEEDALLRLVGSAMEVDSALMYASKKIDSLEKLQRKVGLEDKESIDALRLGIAGNLHNLTVMLIKALGEYDYVDIEDLLSAVDDDE